MLTDTLPQTFTERVLAWLEKRPIVTHFHVCYGCGRLFKNCSCAHADENILCIECDYEDY